MCVYIFAYVLKLIIVEECDNLAMARQIIKWNYILHASKQRFPLAMQLALPGRVKNVSLSAMSHTIFTDNIFVSNFLSICMSEYIVPRMFPHALMFNMHQINGAHSISFANAIRNKFMWKLLTEHC